MINVVVAAARSVAEDVKLFELVSTGEPLPGCDAGAHIEIELALTHGTILRQYSLLDCGDRPESYVIAVLREAQSRGGSHYMHDVIREGDVLRCSKPKNHFPLRNEALGHLLIAGGIGITPILSMARTLAGRTDAFAVNYAARSDTRMAFRREMSDLAGSRTVFHIDGGDPSRGMPLDRILGELPDGWHVYVCGPQGLIRAVREEALRRHISEDSVHSESFVGPKATAGDRPFRVIARDSGVTVEVGANETILDVLVNAGVDILSDCKRGECGTCAVGVISGVINHRDFYLSVKERASNKIICPCVSRSFSEELILEI